jgi:hypothetical protein
VFIDMPRDPDLGTLYKYWNSVRGERLLPARQDIDLTAIPKLLPFAYSYRLAGGKCHSAHAKSVSDFGERDVEI